MTSRDLSAILASRLCHDLVSPVGAIENGLDLIREIGAGGGIGAELDMIGQSAARASKLLKFYRLAFGRAEAEAEPIARDRLNKDASDVVSSERVKLAIEAVHGPPIPRPEARVLSLLLLCARHVAGASGTIRAQVPIAGPLPIAAEITSARGISSDGAARLFDPDSQEEPVPRYIEFALLHDAVATLNLTLQAAHREDRMQIQIYKS